MYSWIRPKKSATGAKKTYQDDECSDKGKRVSGSDCTTLDEFTTPDGTISRTSSEPKSLLLGLSKEILLEIADYLTPYEFNLLSISCRRLRFNIGRTPINSYEWLELDRPGQSVILDHRIAFLNHLTDGYPYYFVCRNCNALHKTSAVMLPGRVPTNSDTEVKCGSGFRPHDVYGDYLTDWLVSSNKYYRLTSLHIQLALKRYHYGAPYGIDLRSLSYAEIVKNSSTSKPLTTALHVTPRIASGRMYTRTQLWLLSSATHVGHSSYKYDDHDLQICAHITQSDINDLLRCKLDNRHNRNCETCPPYLRCYTCGTEFHVREEQVLTCSALVLNIWRELGQGESPQDRSWQKHMVRDGKGRHDTVFTEADPVDGCRAIFEGQRGNPAESVFKELSSVMFASPCSDTKEHRDQLPLVTTGKIKTLPHWPDSLGQFTRVPERSCSTLIKGYTVLQDEVCCWTRYDIDDSEVMRIVGRPPTG